TQVVRGADLLASTARQLALCAALGYPAPRMYAHVPLAADGLGVRLAKRTGALGLEPLRARGLRREEVLGMLAASCGIWPRGAPATLDGLLAAFDAAHIHDVGPLLAP
ncbi:MAG: tRNA glutamyl-Q(34) synthetase GluQRS, partial [Ktedonobacterales bacterium]